MQKLWGFVQPCALPLPKCLFHDKEQVLKKCFHALSASCGAASSSAQEIAAMSSSPDKPDSPPRRGFLAAGIKAVIDDTFALSAHKRVPVTPKSAPPPHKPDSPERRKALATGVKAIIAVMVAGVTVPLAGFFVSPAIKKGKSAWTPLGDISNLKDGEPLKMTYSYTRTDGWMRERARGTVFVMRDDKGEVYVLSSKCPHLGCGVNWDSATTHFECPCHGGVFDTSGKVLAGPPPRGLARLECKVEGNTLSVLIMEA
jgi:Rieske Fe-S protein